MPPKSRGKPKGGGRGRGRPRKAVSKVNSEESEGDDVASESSSVKSVKKNKTRSSRKAPAMEPRFPQPTGIEAGTPIVRLSRRRKAKDAIPDVLQEMIDEVADSTPERPLKKRKIRGRGTSTENSEKAPSLQPRDRDSSTHFEDIPSPKSKQTFFRESDDDSDENDVTWEDVDVDLEEEDLSEASPQPGPSTSNLRDLDLNLSINTEAPHNVRSIVRRKPMTKEEMKIRINTHKMHILCLLAHIDIRNNWCNDARVHDILRPLLTPRIMKFFRPERGSAADQMARIDSIKAGLNFANYTWNTNFQITAKGSRRSLWADREDALHNLALPDDADSVHDIDDFRTAAQTLSGSRDVGAQLYCAFLRCAGLDVRLVCSLQPLSCKKISDEPSMLITAVLKNETESSEAEEEPLVNIRTFPSPLGGNASSNSGAVPLAATRRRLGGSTFTNLPTRSTPTPNHSSHSKKKAIKESPYPIYWVEVLCDRPTARWIPVDSLVLKNIDRRLTFEPPASDRENSMRYVVAFEDDGRVREVTRRYTKAFNSKTRRLRVESTEGGETWWRQTMERFSRGFVSGVDDVEDLEMARYDSQEPMPKSIAHFKDHPVYALERHLKRNEVLVTKREIGKIAAGVKVGTNGGAFNKTKKLESVYRRSDVKTTKSADGWYRVGREVKIGEQPVKTVPARNRADDDMDIDAEDGVTMERAGIGLYTEDQTQLYEPPPVVNGRVPTNSYGNLDIYVSSMVPKGGVHIPDPEAKLAARLIGVHSADAVIGFEFRGRHGTAVIKGIVVAVEFREAIEAVIQGLKDEQQNAEDERRTLVALRMWKKFMIGLRVKERIAGYEIEGERDDDLQVEDPDVKASGTESELDDDEYIEDEYGGGGFFLE